MKKRCGFFVVIGSLLFSCGTPRDHSDVNDEISGTYAREYSFKVINQETGIEIGMRTIRDTIIVRSLDSGFEITNSKWQLNQYDKEGWQNMKHMDNRPKPSFIGTLDMKGGTIISRDGTELHCDAEKSVVFWNPSELYNKTSN